MDLSEPTDRVRTCAQCDQPHHEDDGAPCDVCEEWICTDCWRGLDGETPHDQTDEHGRREGGG